MTYRIGGRTLFDAASVTIPAGHRVGLVGRNGTGKSTLLALLTGDAQPDEGDISVSGIAGRANAIGVVRQEAPGGSETPLEFTLATDSERVTLLAEAAIVTDPERIATIQARLVDIGAHAAPARAATILAGLGLDETAQKRPLSELSGGWRMRVAIAALLFAEPELLLLDEPTNHLDLEAALWLEAHLCNYRNTAIIVSHDRELLNRAVTGILHLEQLKLTYYPGGYDRFAKVRSERLALQERSARKLMARRRHMQAFVDRFRYKASKARQAQSRLKALERMDPVPDVAAETSTAFLFPEPESLPPPLITFDQVATGYLAGQPVLRNLDLRLDSDDRIGFLGQNGNGKSTLARLIADRLPTMEGDVHRAAKLRVGYFDQHQLDDLVAEDNAIEHLARLMPEATGSRVRSRLGGFRLIQDRQTTKVKHLSGGERARLTIAMITSHSPNVLILDEPTNHLDIDAREALISALNDYSGAVILISHDRRLLELTVDRLWLVADGTVRPFDGDLSDYEKWLRGLSRNNQGQEQNTDDGHAAGRGNRKETRRLAAAVRQRTADIRKAVRDAERALDKLMKERDDIIENLSQSTFYETNSTQDIKNIILRKEHLDREIGAAEDTWLQAVATLEAAE